jgi:hypothetical protein
MAKMATNEDYYVYVYIDPRNHEEFYYGKGRGSRKDEHLKDKSDNDKANRIAAIRKQGLEPLIRVIARGLTQSEALLIEKTLLWKLGKWTTNIATGHFSKKFRPHNTLHKEVFGFDFENGLYYYNVGENAFRNWDDYAKYGFISAGRGTKNRDAIKAFNRDDLIAAYLKTRGFVGVGRILETAKRIRDVLIKGTPLLNLKLTATDPDHDGHDDELCEYVCLVKWLKRVPREEAKKSSAIKLFTNPQIRATLDGHPNTIRFIEREFGISIKDALR